MSARAQAEAMAGNVSGPGAVSPPLKRMKEPNPEDPHQCPVCLDEHNLVMYGPYGKGVCGHKVCQWDTGIILESKYPRCPLCRTPITKLSKDPNVDPNLPLVDDAILDRLRTIAAKNAYNAQHGRIPTRALQEYEMEEEMEDMDEAIDDAEMEQNDLLDAIQRAENEEENLELAGAVDLAGEVRQERVRLERDLRNAQRTEARIRRLQQVEIEQEMEEPLYTRPAVINEQEPFTAADRSYLDASRLTVSENSLIQARAEVASVFDNYPVAEIMLWSMPAVYNVLVNDWFAHGAPVDYFMNAQVREYMARTIAGIRTQGQRPVDFGVRALPHHWVDTLTAEQVILYAKRRARAADPPGSEDWSVEAWRAWMYGLRVKAFFPAEAFPAEF